jgi:hypothetical protein
MCPGTRIPWYQEFFQQLVSVNYLWAEVWNMHMSGICRRLDSINFLCEISSVSSRHIFRIHERYLTFLMFPTSQLLLFQSDAFHNSKNTLPYSWGLHSQKVSYASRLHDHFYTTHAVGFLCTRDRPGTEISIRKHTTFISYKHPCHGGIRNHNPCKRAGADPRLRPARRWDRRKHTVTPFTFFLQHKTQCTFTANIPH